MSRKFSFTMVQTLGLVCLCVCMGCQPAENGSEKNVDETVTEVINDAAMEQVSGTDSPLLNETVDADRVPAGDVSQVPESNNESANGEESFAEVETVPVDEKTKSAIVAILQNGALLCMGMNGTYEEILAHLNQGKNVDFSSCPEDFKTVYLQYIDSVESGLNTASQMAKKQESAADGGEESPSAENNSGEGGANEQKISGEMRIGAIVVDLGQLSKEEYENLTGKLNNMMEKLFALQNTSIKYIGKDSYLEAIGLEEE